MREIDKDILEFAMTVERRTEYTYQLNDGDNIEWYPKSVIDWDMIYNEDPAVGDTTTFYIPEWLAYKKGLI